MLSPENRDLPRAKATRDTRTTHTVYQAKGIQNVHYAADPAYGNESYSGKCVGKDYDRREGASAVRE